MTAQEALRRAQQHLVYLERLRTNRLEFWGESFASFPAFVRDAEDIEYYRLIVLGLAALAAADPQKS